MYELELFLKGCLIGIFSIFIKEIFVEDELYHKYEKRKLLDNIIAYGFINILYEKCDKLFSIIISVILIQSINLNKNNKKKEILKILVEISLSYLLLDENHKFNKILLEILLFVFSSN